MIPQICDECGKPYVDINGLTMCLTCRQGPEMFPNVDGVGYDDEE